MLALTVCQVRKTHANSGSGAQDFTSFVASVIEAVYVQGVDSPRCGLGYASESLRLG